MLVLTRDHILVMNAHRGNTCTNEADNLVNIAAHGNDTIQANIEQNLHKKNHVQEQIPLAVLRPKYSKYISRLYD
jgi:hypothetical protein